MQSFSFRILFQRLQCSFRSHFSLRARDYFSRTGFFFGLSSRSSNFGIYFCVGIGDFYLNCTLLFVEANGRDDFAAPSAITMDAAWMAALQNLLPPALHRVFLAQRCRGTLGNCTCVLFATGTHFYSVKFSTQSSKNPLLSFDLRSDKFMKRKLWYENIK